MMAVRVRLPAKRSIGADRRTSPIDSVSGRQTSMAAASVRTPPQKVAPAIATTRATSATPSPAAL